MAKATLIIKNNAGTITLTDFKIYDKTIVIKTTFYQQKNRYIDQQSRI